MNWMKMRLNERSSEWSTPEDMTLLLVTFNINEKILSSDTFQTIFNTNVEANVDMVFVVVQEIDMSMSGILKESKLTQKGVSFHRCLSTFSRLSTNGGPAPW